VKYTNHKKLAVAAFFKYFNDCFISMFSGFVCEVDGCCQKFENWTLLRKHKAVDHKKGKSLHCLQLHFNVSNHKSVLFGCSQNLLTKIRNYKNFQTTDMTGLPNQ